MNNAIVKSVNPVYTRNGAITAIEYLQTLHIDGMIDDEQYEEHATAMQDTLCGEYRLFHELGYTGASTVDIDRSPVWCPDENCYMPWYAA